MDQDHLGIRSDEALWNNSHGFIKRHESYLDTLMMRSMDDVEEEESNEIFKGLMKSILDPDGEEAEEEAEELQSRFDKIGNDLLLPNLSSSSSSSSSSASRPARMLRMEIKPLELNCLATQLRQRLHQSNPTPTPQLDLIQTTPDELDQQLIENYSSSDDEESTTSEISDRPSKNFEPITPPRTLKGFHHPQFSTIISDDSSLDHSQHLTSYSQQDALMDDILQILGASETDSLQLFQSTQPLNLKSNQLPSPTPSPSPSPSSSSSRPEPITHSQPIEKQIISFDHPDIPRVASLPARPKPIPHSISTTTTHLSSRALRASNQSFFNRSPISWIFRS